MDKVIFSACVYNWKEGFCGPSTDMNLPATEYELEDALQKVRDGEGGETLVSVESFGDFPFLRSHIGEEDIRALNALANKLTTLEGWQIDAFEGLVRMDENNGVGIDPPRLYDLAASVDSCQVLYTDDDYESIGRFYAENGFVPELENLPDILWEILDFRQLGQRMAAQEGGVFINNDHGYVVRIDDLKEEFKDLNLTPKKPDYTVLLELSARDTEESIPLKLPCSRSVLDAALIRLKVDDWSEFSWRCADCRIPALREAFNQTDSIVIADSTAARITQLSAEKILSLKALVEATQCSDLFDAVKLIDSMDEYTFTRKYDGPEAVALDELSFLLGENDRATLLPFVDLYRYGEKLIEEQNISMTPYGGIERKDRQPIQAVCHEPQMGGMSMM